VNLESESFTSNSSVRKTENSIQDTEVQGRLSPSFQQYHCPSGGSALAREFADFPGPGEQVGSRVEACTLSPKVVTSTEILALCSRFSLGGTVICPIANVHCW